MNNTRSLLLITIIAATLVLGTNVIPMQSYADRGGSDDRKKDNDYKSKTSASYESDKKSSKQNQDQDNFCYRGDDCEQANQGQQIVGKNNDAKGFNDQSDNLSIEFTADNGTGNGNGNGNGGTPQEECELCIANTDLTTVFANPGLVALGINTTAELCAFLAGPDSILRDTVLILLVGVLDTGEEECLLAAGIDLTVRP
jgi:hypothetical protein